MKTQASPSLPDGGCETWGRAPFQRAQPRVPLPGFRQVRGLQDRVEAPRCLLALPSTRPKALASLALRMPAQDVPSTGRPGPSTPSWTDIFTLHTATCLLLQCFPESPCDCPLLPNLCFHSTHTSFCLPTPYTLL